MLFEKKYQACVFSATIEYALDGKRAIISGSLGKYTLEISSPLNQDGWKLRLGEFQHVMGIWPDPDKVPGGMYDTEIQFLFDRAKRVKYIECVNFADYRALTRTECAAWK